MLNSIDTTPEAKENNSATYCPEDDKIRIYIDGGNGRVSRESWLHLKSCGYKPTPKQSCTFVATWSIKAEDAAIELIPDCQDIEDEDISPAERAVQRAERFAGYRDKRRSESHEFADRFDSMGAVYGNENQNQADRRAKKADRVRKHAVTQWSKAEYWQRRTEGVISNALHRSSASVRRGRILAIEKEIRRVESSYTPRDGDRIIQNDRNGEECEHAWCGQGRGGHWVPVKHLESFKRSYARYIDHLNMRLIYENAMLEHEGGKASEVDIIPGGFIRVGVARRTREVINVDGWAQILKVNKSSTTGRVTSVVVLGREPYGYAKQEDREKIRELKINIERSGEDCYRAPTDEELREFKESEKKRKASTKKKKAPSLLNLNNEDALKLQEHWNAKAKEMHEARNAYGDFQPSSVVEMTQREYSAISKGTYGHGKTLEICEHGHAPKTRYGRNIDDSPIAFKVRRMHAGGNNLYGADRLIVIVDKKRHSLPISLEPVNQNPTVSKLVAEPVPAKVQAELFPIES